jgi:hypothetical protein
MKRLSSQNLSNVTHSAKVRYGNSSGYNKIYKWDTIKLWKQAPGAQLIEINKKSSITLNKNYFIQNQTSARKGEGTTSGILFSHMSVFIRNADNLTQLLSQA